jgi:hypothetical protein
MWGIFLLMIFILLTKAADVCRSESVAYSNRCRVKLIKIRWCMQDVAECETSPTLMPTSLYLVQLVIRLYTT